MMVHSLSRHKWGQFLEDVRLHWGLPEDSIGQARDLPELAVTLREALDLSETRLELELQVLMLVFKQRVLRARAIDEKSRHAAA